MRVLLLSHEMTYTGAPQSLLNMARVFRNHFNHVTVCTQKCGSFVHEYHKYGFRVGFIDPNNYNYESLSRKYDLVIANTIFCGEFALKAKKYVPTILYVREAHNIPEIIKNCNLSNEYISKADNIICVSEYAEEFILHNYNVRRLYVLHNFLYVPHLFKPKKNIIENNEIHLLVAGTIEERKGYDIAINALRKLSGRTSLRVILHIAGRKPEWARKYWESIDIENADNIIYHGEIINKHEMWRLYDYVNVVIVPSLDESCSMTALEGALHGRALIISENVGARYILDNDKYIFRQKSPDDLANKIIQLAADDELCETGNRLYKRILETSTQYIYYNNLRKILSDCCKTL